MKNDYLTSISPVSVEYPTALLWGNSQLLSFEDVNDIVLAIENIRGKGFYFPPSTI